MAAIFGLKRRIVGYTKCKIAKTEAWRLVNICKKRRIYLWSVKFDEKEAFEVYVLTPDIAALKEVVAFTGGEMEVLTSGGLPVVLKRMFMRKYFYIGAVSACLIVYGLSRFIWDIDISGNSFYADETIIGYLKEINAGPGSLKKKITPSEVEEDLRLQYPRISWVSAQIIGTKLKLVLEEGTPDTEVKKEEKRVISADYDGTVMSVMLRSGTALVHKGDEVKKGDVLVEGKNEIYNDDGTVSKTIEVNADADVVVRTKLSVDRSYSRKYNKKIYHDKQYKTYELNVFGFHIKLPDFFKEEESGTYEEVQFVKKFRLTPNFYLPLSVKKTERRVYALEPSVYSENEIKAIAEENIKRCIDKLEESGTRLVENHIESEMTKDSLKLKGYLTVDMFYGPRPSE